MKINNFTINVYLILGKRTACESQAGMERNGRETWFGAEQGKSKFIGQPLPALNKLSYILSQAVSTMCTIPIDVIINPFH